MTFKPLKLIALALAITAVVAGCGSGGNTNTAADVPAAIVTPAAPTTTASAAPVPAVTKTTPPKPTYVAGYCLVHETDIYHHPLDAYYKANSHFKAISADPYFFVHYQHGRYEAKSLSWQHWTYIPSNAKLPPSNKIQVQKSDGSFGPPNDFFATPHSFKGGGHKDYRDFFFAYIKVWRNLVGHVAKCR